MLDFEPYPSADAHKLLTDNRDRYIAQSAATRNGVVAEFPARLPSAQPAPAGFPKAGTQHHTPAGGRQRNSK